MSDLRNRIYIGKLHYDVREKDIERFFKDFGKINDINMKNGYAFVDFDDHRDADDAVYEMDGKDLLGDRVSVEHCKGGRDRRDERRGGGGYSGGDRHGGGYGGDRGGSSRFKHSFSLFERPFNTKHRVVVEGLSSSTDWRDLKDFFRRVAEVTFADAHRFRTGEGVADFRSREDLRRVIRELDDTKLNGRRVRLTEEKQSRSRSKSRSPRRSARRSRSRSRSADRSRGSRTKDDRRSASTEKRDYRSKSRSRSPEDKRSRSRSKDRRSHTPEKRSKSMERRSRSPEKRSRSKSPKEDEGKSGDLKEADTFERSKSESPEKEAEMEAADTVAKDGE